MTHTRKTHSDTRIIRQQLDAKHVYSKQLENYSEKKVAEAQTQIVMHMNKKVGEMEEEAAIVLEMFKDLHALIHDQQPLIDEVQKTLASVKTETEQVQATLEEIEHPRRNRCIIL